MSLDPMKTVREVAVALPNATRVFEKTKIDYCCGGDQLLGEACKKAGVDLQMLAEMLDTNVEPASKAEINFQELTLGELITHILDKHHVYTKEEMERLEALTLVKPQRIGLSATQRPIELVAQFLVDLGVNIIQLAEGIGVQHAAARFISQLAQGEIRLHKSVVRNAAVIGALIRRHVKLADGFRLADNVNRHVGPDRHLAEPSRSFRSKRPLERGRSRPEETARVGFVQRL